MHNLALALLCVILFFNPKIGMRLHFVYEEFAERIFVEVDQRDWVRFRDSTIIKNENVFCEG
jgi:hypothetical protein